MATYSKIYRETAINLLIVVGIAFFFGMGIVGLIVELRQLREPSGSD